MVGGEEVAEPVADGRGGVADGVQGALQAGAWPPLLGGVASPRCEEAGAVGCLGEVEEVFPFGRVELQGSRDCFEDAGGHAGEVAAFEFGVVLDAHSGQAGDLPAAQAGDSSLAVFGQAGLGGGDLGAAGGQELAHLGSVVHASTLNRIMAWLGSSAGTPFRGDFFPVVDARWLTACNES